MIKYKSYDKERAVIGFFHGIDLATQNDYYTDVVHVLPEKPKLDVHDPNTRFTWMPFLVGIMRLKKKEPNEMIDDQINMFNKFPPMLAEIDISREDFLGNAMQRKYGEGHIILQKFINAGTSNTKFHLKQIGYSYLQGGYEWPNDTQLEKTMPRFAKLIRILKKEMIHEQIEYTNNGRITFNEPVGKHNDLVHGWEMSLDAAMQFQQKNLGYEKTVPQNAEFKSIMDDVYGDYPDEDLVYDDVFERGSSSSALV